MGRSRLARRSTWCTSVKQVDRPTKSTRSRKNCRSDALGRRFKNRHTFNVRSHRYDVGLSRLQKSAGHSNLIGSRPGLLASRASNERHGRQPALAAWGPPPQCVGHCMFKLVDEEAEKADQTPPAPSVNVPKCVGRPHRLVSTPTPPASRSRRTPASRCVYRDGPAPPTAPCCAAPSPVACSRSAARCAVRLRSEGAQPTRVSGWVSAHAGHRYGSGFPTRAGRPGRWG